MAEKQEAVHFAIGEEGFFSLNLFKLARADISCVMKRSRVVYLMDGSGLAIDVEMGLLVQNLNQLES